MIFQRIFIYTLFLAIVSIHHSAARKFFAGDLLKNGPPPPNNEALMARYIAHNSDWASVGTISVHDSISGFPFVGLKSIADGPEANGTGVPYMLMTNMDISMNDLNHDNRCTLFMSLAQGDYCKTKKYDPQDPRCARIMLTGTIEKVLKGSEEETFARNALYSRHPAMKSWPMDHGFFIVKLDISNVFVLDFFGGIKTVTPKDYYAANADSYQLLDKLAQKIDVIQITF